MTSDIEKALKDKLRNLAKEQGRDPGSLWQNLCLERFLVRLAKSRYREHLILKGGILLSKYIEIGRETIDLDFLARKLINKVVDLKGIFEEIANIDLDDGFAFEEVKVKELLHPHMGYPGAEVSMTAYYGKIRFKVAIDIGFGDIVSSIEYSIPLTKSSKGSLFEKNVNLYCYPKEFIFAEKLETIIYRGSFNSRMKDFHDIYSMISSSFFESFYNLKRIIRLVFEHRETPFTFPIAYSASEMLQMQSFWNEYLKNLPEKISEKLPKAFASVVDEINNWLSTKLSL